MHSIHSNLFSLLCRFVYYLYNLLQREEANTVSARNMELTHLLVDYEKRIRESSDSSQACEENL